jgi:hypothetical protein
MIFTTQILSFGENSLGYGPYFILPQQEIKDYLEKNNNNKRVKCTLNNITTIDRAISKKDDFFYILINKELLKELKITFGDTVSVELIPDDSQYGVAITEEMLEVLFQDPDGSTLFHKLTPGKQRSLIIFVNNIKSSQLRIEKSFVILEHLKNQMGNLDMKQLMEDFKNHRNNYKF